MRPCDAVRETDMERLDNAGLLTVILIVGRRERDETAGLGAVSLFATLSVLAFGFGGLAWWVIFAECAV